MICVALVSANRSSLLERHVAKNSDRNKDSWSPIERFTGLHPSSTTAGFEDVVLDQEKELVPSNHSNEEKNLYGNFEEDPDSNGNRRNPQPLTEKSNKGESFVSDEEVLTLQIPNISEDSTSDENILLKPFLVKLDKNQEVSQIVTAQRGEEVDEELREQSRMLLVGKRPSFPRLNPSSEILLRSSNHKLNLFDREEPNGGSASQRFREMISALSKMNPAFSAGMKLPYQSSNKVSDIPFNDLYFGDFSIYAPVTETRDNQVEYIIHDYLSQEHPPLITTAAVEGYQKENFESYKSDSMSQDEGTFATARIGLENLFPEGTIDWNPQRRSSSEHEQGALSNDNENNQKIVTLDQEQEKERHEEDDDINDSHNELRFKESESSKDDSFATKHPENEKFENESHPDSIPSSIFDPGNRDTITPEASEIVQSIARPEPLPTSLPLINPKPTRKSILQEKLEGVTHKFNPDDSVFGFHQLTRYGMGSSPYERSQVMDEITGYSDYDYTYYDPYYDYSEVTPADLTSNTTFDNKNLLLDNYPPNIVPPTVPTLHLHEYHRLDNKKLYTTTQSSEKSENNLHLQNQSIFNPDYKNDALPSPENPKFQTFTTESAKHTSPSTFSFFVFNAVNQSKASPHPRPFSSETLESYLTSTKSVPYSDFAIKPSPISFLSEDEYSEGSSGPVISDSSYNNKYQEKINQVPELATHPNLDAHLIRNPVVSQFSTPFPLPVPPKLTLETHEKVHNLGLKNPLQHLSHISPESEVLQGYQSLSKVPQITVKHPSLPQQPYAGINPQHLNPLLSSLHPLSQPNVHPQRSNDQEYTHDHIHSYTTTENQNLSQDHIYSHPTTENQDYSHDHISNHPTTENENYLHDHILYHPKTNNEDYLHDHIESSPSTESMKTLENISTSKLYSSSTPRPLFENVSPLTNVEQVSTPFQATTLVNAPVSFVHTIPGNEKHHLEISSQTLKQPSIESEPINVLANNNAQYISPLISNFNKVIAENEAHFNLNNHALNLRLLNEQLGKNIAIESGIFLPTHNGMPHYINNIGSPVSPLLFGLQHSPFLNNPIHVHGNLARLSPSSIFPIQQPYVSLQPPPVIQSPPIFQFEPPMFRDANFNSNIDSSKLVATVEQLPLKNLKEIILDESGRIIEETFFEENIVEDLKDGLETSMNSTGSAGINSTSVTTVSDITGTHLENEISKDSELTTLDDSTVGQFETTLDSTLDDPIFNGSEEINLEQAVSVSSETSIGESIEDFISNENTSSESISSSKETSTTAPQSTSTSSSTTNFIEEFISVTPLGTNGVITPSARTTESSVDLTTIADMIRSDSKPVDNEISIFTTLREVMRGLVGHPSYLVLPDEPSRNVPRIATALESRLRLDNSRAVSAAGSNTKEFVLILSGEDAGILPDTGDFSVVIPQLNSDFALSQELTLPLEDEIFTESRDTQNSKFEDLKQFKRNIDPLHFEDRPSSARIFSGKIEFEEHRRTKDNVNKTLALQQEKTQRKVDLNSDSHIQLGDLTRFLELAIGNMKEDSKKILDERFQGDPDLVHLDTPIYLWRQGSKQGFEVRFLDNMHFIIPSPLEKSSSSKTHEVTGTTNKKKLFGLAAFDQQTDLESELNEKDFFTSLIPGEKFTFDDVVTTNTQPSVSKSVNAKNDRSIENLTEIGDENRNVSLDGSRDLEIENFSEINDTNSITTELPIEISSVKYLSESETDYFIRKLQELFSVPETEIDLSRLNDQTSADENINPPLVTTEDDLTADYTLEDLINSGIFQTLSTTTDFGDTSASLDSTELLRDISSNQDIDIKRTSPTIFSNIKQLIDSNQILVPQEPLLFIEDQGLQAASSNQINSVAQPPIPQVVTQNNLVKNSNTGLHSSSLTTPVNPQSAIEYLEMTRDGANLSNGVQFFTSLTTASSIPLVFENNAQVQFDDVLFVSNPNSESSNLKSQASSPSQSEEVLPTNVSTAGSSQILSAQKKPEFQTNFMPMVLSFSGTRNNERNQSRTWVWKDTSQIKGPNLNYGPPRNNRQMINFQPAIEPYGSRMLQKPNRLSRSQIDLLVAGLQPKRHSESKVTSSNVSQTNPPSFKIKNNGASSPNEKKDRTGTNGPQTPSVQDIRNLEPSTKNSWRWLGKNKHDRKRRSVFNKFNSYVHSAGGIR